MVLQQQNTSEILQNLIFQNKWQPVEETTKNLIGYCIFHNDKNIANLHITKIGKWKGYFKCFACGASGKISEEFVDKMSKLKTINRKLTPIPIDWNKLNSDYQINAMINGTHWELERLWNVDCLNKYCIGWDNFAYTFPMRREDITITGILRRFPDGHKICIEGSQLGLFIPNMPITQVVVTEGVSDAAVATECGFFGIGLPSATFGHVLVKKFLDNQNYFGKVLITADADKAGKKSAEKMKKVLTFRYDCVIIEPEEHKDLKCFYQRKGKDKTIKLLRGE